MRHAGLPLMLVTMAACGGGNDRPSTVVIDTLPGGVEHVRNTGPSAWPGMEGWRLELEQVIAPEAGAPGELVNPRSIVADARGHVYVMESRPAAIHHYAPDGSYLGAIAREGAGPGEVSRQAVLMMVHDTLVAHDQSQARTTLWAPDGTLLRSWASQCCVVMPAQADRMGRIPVPGMVFQDQQATTPEELLGYVRFGTDGSVSDTVGLPRGGPEPSVWEFATPGGTNIMLRPFEPSVHAWLSAEGLMIGGSTAHPSLVTSRTGRDTVRMIEWPAAPVAIPDSVRQAALDELLRDSPEAAGVARLGDLRREYAAWTDVAGDGDGNIWVLLPGPAGPADHWRVFSPEGILLGDVATPGVEFTRAFWGRDRVYAVVENAATGLPEIRIYRIVRS